MELDDIDLDCDMPEIRRLDEDTDLESFEREERRMEEEAAKVINKIIRGVKIDLRN